MALDSISGLLSFLKQACCVFWKHQALLQSISDIKKGLDHAQGKPWDLAMTDDTSLLLAWFKSRWEFRSEQILIKVNG